MPEIEHRVEMSHIHKSFDGVVALHDVNFSVKPGKYTLLLAKTVPENPRSFVSFQVPFNQIREK